MNLVSALWTLGVFAVIGLILLGCVYFSTAMAVIAVVLAWAIVFWVVYLFVEDIRGNGDQRDGDIYG